MATADLLQELATDLQNAYVEVSNKGGTIPANKNTNNLATAIASIPSGGVQTETIKKTLTAEATGITFEITSGQVPKAIELWNENEGETLQSGEIRKVFFITQGGAIYRNNRVNGQNGWLPCTLSGDNVSYARITLGDQSVSVGRVSNAYYLENVEYTLICYYW